MVRTIQTVTKWQQLLDILRAALDRGEFKPGEQMPSENDLVGTYGVGKSTIREAISGLVQEGRLVRLHGKGTFVREAAPVRLKTCALFLRAYGHLHSTLTKAVVSAVQAQRMIPMVFDLDEMHSGDPAGERTPAFLGEVLDRGVDAIITEGSSRWLIDCCAKQKRTCPPLAVINEAHLNDPSQVRVLSDARAGTAAGTRYLMDLGHRHILFVIHCNPYLPAATPPEAATGVYGEIIRGYFETVGGSRHARLFLIPDEFKTAATRERLREVLLAPDRPTAVFAYEDYRAKCVMEIAADCGLSVPGDLSVLGYFNTPWAEHTAVPLSSMSINEELIALRAVAQLQGNPATWPVTERVAPVLIERASCAAPCQQPAAVGAY